MPTTISGTSGVTFPAGGSGNPTSAVVGISDTQTLTNKTIQGGTITSGTAVASTSGTSIDFTGIPAYVKRITVMFSGVSTNGTSIPQIQLGDAGGIETTSYVSLRANIDGTNATSIQTATSGFSIKSSVTDATTFTGTAVISNLTGNSWVCSSFGQQTNNAVLTTQNGSKTLSDTLTQVRITTVNGTDTFDAGSINILYE